MRSSVPNLYSTRRRILTRRKLRGTQFFQVEAHLGDQLEVQIHTAREDWSVKVQHPLSIREVLQRAQSGMPLNSLTHYHEDGSLGSHAIFPLPARLVRFNFPIGTAMAAFFLIISGQERKVDWSMVDYTQIMGDPNLSPWEVVHRVTRHRTKRIPRVA